MALPRSKLPPRYAVSDWHTSNKILRTNAERLRYASHDIRQDARKLRNETENHTRWTQHASDTKLENRIDDINEWKEVLERCLENTRKEIESLQSEKEKTERALDAKNLPLDVALECLMLRENRVGIDLVRDEVEEQIHKEIEVIEGIKALLQQKIGEAFEQLCLLQEAQHQLHCDITDKKVALDIDNTCAQLGNGSSDIYFHANPTRIMKGIVTPETWDAHSQYNKMRADAEMTASERLREAIFSTLEKTKNDLEAQRRATEYSYRKRIHETKQAKSELEWQQHNTKEEIAILESDIKGLKQSIEDKMAPMKVAQTRLENRTFRPNAELCRDIPQYHLSYEVGEIDGSIKALIEKLQTAESALQSLNGDLARITEDLAIKTNSLALDNNCLEIRKKLTNPELISDNIVDDATKGILNLSANEMERVSPSHEVIEKDTIEFKANEDLQRNLQPRKSLNDADVMTRQIGKHSSIGHNEQMLDTTYNTSYQSKNTSLRSGDLARTLGRSQEQYGMTKDRKEILVD